MDKSINNIKWYTILEIVDITTGEIIKKSEYERRNLRIINKTIKTEKNEKFGTRTITWECREHEQYTLFGNT